MEISKQEIDSLNAVLQMKIAKEDYSEKVNQELKKYRKQAVIPGFRKGFVPLGLIKKKYEKSLIIQEVNELLQSGLNDYIAKEQLDLLGKPLPKTQDDFSWETENFTFEFELGLAPKFSVQLSEQKGIKKYKIIADQAFVNKEIENLKIHYGKETPQNTIDENSKIKGKVIFEEKNIEKNASFSLQDLKTKSNQQKFIGKKKDDTVLLKTKNLFKEEYLLGAFLGLPAEQVKDLDAQAKFTITEIHQTIPAELNQELFDKIFGKDIVKNEKELKAKIKENAEKNFAVQAEQHFLNSTLEYLVANIKFDLPAAFLKKWLQSHSKESISEKQAAEEYKKSEKSLRYQLIESQILKAHGIEIQESDLKTYAADFIKKQMAMYGRHDMPPEQLAATTEKILQNEKEANRLQGQLISEKLLAVFQEKIPCKIEEVSYDSFVKKIAKK